MINNISGIILAGGKSSRMGKDKSFILLGGKPLIEIIIAKFTALFKKVIIITNNPGAYRKYGLETREDVIKERGPLGGIHTALLFSKNVYNAVVACDMPLVNTNFVEYMAGLKKGYDCVIPQWQGRLEPLCGIYSKTCAPTIGAQLKDSPLKVREIFKRVKTRFVPEAKIRLFDPQGESFLNINTKKDLKHILKIIKSPSLCT